MISKARMPMGTKPAVGAQFTPVEVHLPPP